MALRWFDLATAVCVGGLSLIDPGPLGPWQRTAYRGAIAVLAGAMTWQALSPGVRPGVRPEAPGGSDGDDDEAQFGPYGEYGAHAPRADAGVRRRSQTAAQRELRVAYTIAASGLALGLSGPAEALDGLIQRELTRAGVRHPRRVMAAAAVLASLGNVAGVRRAGVDGSAAQPGR